MSLPIPLWIYLLSLGGSLTLTALLVVQWLGRPAPGVGWRHEQGREPAPPIWRIGWLLIDRLAPLCRLIAPSAVQVRMAGQLREAGLELSLSPAHFLAGRVLLAGVVGVCSLLAFGIGRLWLVLLLSLLAYAFPALRLAEQVRARRQRLRRDLPVILDLVGLGVQSGMTTSAAIALAVERGPAGPLRDEFARVMREVKAGRSRQEALRAMAERYDVPGLRHAIAAIVIAEKQGADLSPVLQAQASQRREERFIDAERRAMQAPVKLLLPLVAFIFPGTFLVLMFPIVMQVIADGFL